VVQEVFSLEHADVQHWDGCCHHLSAILRPATSQPQGRIDGGIYRRSCFVYRRLVEPVYRRSTQRYNLSSQVTIEVQVPLQRHGETCQRRAHSILVQILKSQFTTPVFTARQGKSCKQGLTAASTRSINRAMKLSEVRRIQNSYKISVEQRKFGRRQFVRARIPVWFHCKNIWKLTRWSRDSYGKWQSPKASFSQNFRGRVYAWIPANRKTDKEMDRLFGTLSVWLFRSLVFYIIQ